MKAADTPKVSSNGAACDSWSVCMSTHDVSQAECQTGWGRVSNALYAAATSAVASPCSGVGEGVGWGGSGVGQQTRECFISCPNHFKA